MPKAVEWLISVYDQLTSLHELLQMSIIEVMSRDISDACLNSSSHAVKYEAATTLTTLTQNPAAVKSAALCFANLIIKSDNNVKLIVLDRLDTLRSKHDHILDGLTIDILQVLSSADMEVRRKAMSIVLSMTSNRNVEQVVRFLNKQLQQMQEREFEKAPEYRQLLIQSIHVLAVKFSAVAAYVVHALMEFLEDSNNPSALDVVAFVREVVEKFPHLRQSICDKLIQTLTDIKFGKTFRGVLWIIGEYVEGLSDIQAVFQDIRKVLGEIPIRASEQRLLNEAGGEEDKKVEGSWRPKVPADGTYATETAYTSANSAKLEGVKTASKPLNLEGGLFTGSSQANAESMLIMTSIICVGQSKFVTVPIDEDSNERILNCSPKRGPGNIRRPRYLLEGHESGILQDARHPGAAEKKEPESTKERVMQVDDLLTFRQFNEQQHLQQQHLQQPHSHYPPYHGLHRLGLEHVEYPPQPSASGTVNYRPPARPSYESSNILTPEFYEPMSQDLPLPTHSSQTHIEQSSASPSSSHGSLSTFSAVPTTDERSKHLLFEDAGPYLRETLHIPSYKPIDLLALPDPPEGERPNQPYPILIKLANYGSPNKQLTLQEIYTALEDRFEWFRARRHEKARKNSIRHNLSLNKVFKHVPRAITEPGTGSYRQLDCEGYKRSRKRRSKSARAALEQGDDDDPSSEDDTEGANLPPAGMPTGSSHTPHHSSPAASDDSYLDPESRQGSHITGSKRSGGGDGEVLDLTLPDDSEHNKGEKTALTPKGESKSKGELTLTAATAQKGKDKANGNRVLRLWFDEELLEEFSRFENEAPESCLGLQEGADEVPDIFEGGIIDWNELEKVDKGITPAGFIEEIDVIGRGSQGTEAVWNIDALLSSEGVASM
ncbi:adaptin N terminal region-domain-containing protein [Suillus spraguei]|nr:adaptin N terminal region-domain-containing protein [Suillus spraguei]